MFKIIVLVTVFAVVHSIPVHNQRKLVETRESRIADPTIKHVNGKLDDLESAEYGFYRFRFPSIARSFYPNIYSRYYRYPTVYQRYKQPYYRHRSPYYYSNYRSPYYFSNYGSPYYSTYGYSGSSDSGSSGPSYDHPHIPHVDFSDHIADNGYSGADHIADHGYSGADHIADHGYSGGDNSPGPTGADTSPGPTGGD